MGNRLHATTFRPLSQLQSRHAAPFGREERALSDQVSPWASRTSWSLKYGPNRARSSKSGWKRMIG